MKSSINASAKTSSYENHFKKRKEVMMKKSKKKMGSPQVWLILVACVLAGGSGYYLYIGDTRAEKIFSRVEISILGEALAGETADKSGEKSSETKDREEEKIAADKAQDKADKSAVRKTWSDDEVALFSKLEDRKKTLDARESDLNKLEEELQKQKDVLEKRLAELEEVRGKISARLDQKVKVDQEKVESLVSVYANMKPAQAAKVIEGLNEDLAVEVLTKMKNKSAAEILNLMDSEKAKKISEKYAGYREPASK